MEVIVLASGSKGNATLLKTESTTLLIDAGISMKAMQERLEGGLPDIDGLLLTHSHSDHTKGLRGLYRKQTPPLYTTKPSYAETKKRLDIAPEFMEVEGARPFAFNDVYVFPVELSHDSEATLGFVFEAEGKRVAYVMDTGFIPESDYEHLSNCDLYIFESNYDAGMLFSSERPYYLKRRIDSVKGHLSNSDAAYYLTRLVGEKTRTLVLAHASEECNTETKALDTLSSVFKSYALELTGIEVHVAKQDTPTPWLKV